MTKVTPHALKTEASQVVNTSGSRHLQALLQQYPEEWWAGVIKTGSYVNRNTTSFIKASYGLMQIRRRLAKYRQGTTAVPQKQKYQRRLPCLRDWFCISHIF